MGRFKDAFFLEVWKSLLAIPQRSVPLSSLNSPTTGNFHSVRRSWAELQENLREERMKKSTGMKAVLQDRQDLFYVVNNATGHPCVVLSPAAQSFDPMEGVPAMSVVANIAQAARDIEATLVSTGGLAGFAGHGPGDMSSGGASASTAASPSGGTSSGVVPPAAAATAPAQADAAAAAPAAGTAPAGGSGEASNGTEPRKRKSGWDDEPAPDPTPMPNVSPYEALMQQMGMAASSSSSSKKKKSKTSGAQPPPGMNKRGGYLDLVWTPVLAVVKEREDKQEREMARALLHATEQYKGAEVPVSKLGFDFKVANLKKEGKFKNEKLLEIVQRHPDVFDLVPDTLGGYNVVVQPGAMGVLYSQEELEDKIRAEACLPAKMDMPYHIRDRMQALRIEIIHSLHHRGGRGTIQEIAQEPGIQSAKQHINAAKKLQDFIKFFPMNFIISTENNGSLVELCGYDVSDQGAIEMAMQAGQSFDNRNRFGRPAPRQPPRFYGKGGKGGGKSSDRHSSGGFSSYGSGGSGPPPGGSNSGFSGPFF